MKPWLVGGMILLAVSTAICAGDKAAIRLAILPVDSNLETVKVSDLLLMHLLKSKKVQLIERTEIARILKEHQLSAAEWTTPATRLRLGSLIPADAFLFLQAAPVTNTTFTRIDLTESRTGIVLGNWLRENHELYVSLDRFLDEMFAALDKQRLPIRQRHLIGLLDFRGEESGLDLENKAVALGEMAMPAIGLITNVIVLDREHLEYLRAEKELTALDQELKASVLLLEGGLRYVPGRQKLAVTVILRPLKGDNPLQRTIEVSADDVTKAKTEIAVAVANLLKVDPPKRADIDRAKEAAIFARQVELWDKWGDHRRAVRAAETAYALDDSQTNRLLLAKALAGEIEPALIASVRANQLLLQYYQLYREAIFAGVTTNLSLPTIGFSRTLVNDKICAESPDMAHELIRLEDKAFRLRLEHYGQYYEKAADSYWNTWQERMESLKTAAPGDSGRQVALLWEGIDAFLEAPASNEWVPVSRMEMLEIIIQLKQSDRIFRDFIEKLIVHDDPYVRLIGHKCRLGILGEYRYPGPGAMKEWTREEIESRRAIFRILLTEIDAQHPYRKPEAGIKGRRWEVYEREYTLFGCLPYYTGSRVDNPSLPKDVFDAELDDSARLISQAVEWGDPWRFVAWRSSRFTYEKMPKWLDGLAENGRPNQALELVTKIMAMTKANPERSPWTYEELLERQSRYERISHGNIVETNTSVVAENGEGWGDYNIIRLPFRLELGWACSYPYPPHWIQGTTPLLCSEGNRLCCVVPRPKNEKTQVVHVSVYDLTSGSMMFTRDVQIDISPDEPIRWGVNVMRDVFAAAMTKDMVYVGTSMGLLAIPLSGGDPRLIRSEDGLPGKLVRSLGWYGDRLYLGLGDHPWVDFGKQASVFASYDPRAGVFDIIASEKSVSKTTPLDGERFYLDTIVGDPEQACVWVEDRKTGIWKFEPASRHFELVKFPGKRLVLSGSRYPYELVLFFVKPDGERTVTGLQQVTRPSLFIPSTASYVDIPSEIDGHGVLSGSQMAAYDGTDVLARLSIDVGPKSSIILPWCTTLREILVLLRGEKAPALLAKLPDGSPLPQVLCLHQSSVGTVVLAQNGEVFLIKRKN